MDVGDTDTWEFYVDQGGDWHWRWKRVSTKGWIVGEPSEGYRSRKDARITPGATVTRGKETSRKGGGERWTTQPKPRQRHRSFGVS